MADDRKRFTGGRRGPDLLSDLFDSVMELSFQHSAPEACACVAGVLTQNLRCDAVLVFSYDINRDEFVVQGEANTGRMDQRVRAKAGSYGVATRSKRGVNLVAAKGDDRADEGCEGGPAMYVPALFHDRLFALVQVARLPGSPAFEADELDAATYISGQLAEALSHVSMRQTAADLADHKPAPAKDTGRRR
ncbi:MAG: GAF domain-containing protein [Deltaproteobacteria bacterium]|nr:GAF domain-containing protein [Deltaproteobacteria bacterium]